MGEKAGMEVLGKKAWVPPGQPQNWAQGDKVHRVGPWLLTQFHLFHSKLTVDAIEGTGAAALKAIPLTSILANYLLELTVVPREPREAEAVALYPGATIVTGA